MKVLIIALLVLGVAVARDDWENQYKWESFRSEHKKMYNSASESFKRFGIFKANMDKIEAHNTQALNGVHGWTMAVNQFADLTTEEFAATMSMCEKEIKSGNPFSLRGSAKVNTVNVPDAVDWSTKGAVTPVKNQEQCGSCWAFSTIGSVEGITAISTGTLLSLSEQQLVDCGGAEGSHGCEGGLMDYGFQYIIDNGGICSEADYPYTAKDGSCKASSCTNVASISGFTDVAQSDESALKAAVAQQPIAIAIEADQSGFQFYSGGVFDGTCGTQLDHGVLAVGYGNQDGKDFWKVKNSWGPSWGMDGYILLVRNIGGAGQCGIAAQPSYATK